MNKEQFMKDTCHQIQTSNVSECTLPFLKPQDIEDLKCDIAASESADITLNHLKIDQIAVDLNTSGEVAAFVDNLQASSPEFNDAPYAVDQNVERCCSAVKNLMVETSSDNSNHGVKGGTVLEQSMVTQEPERIDSMESILKTIADFSPPVKNVLYDVYIQTPGRSLLKQDMTVHSYTSPVFSSGGGGGREKSKEKSSYERNKRRLTNESLVNRNSTRG